MVQKYSLTRRASLPGIANYETSADLPLVNITPGRLAWVNDINSLFVFDTAWQRLDTTNLPPVFSAIPTELTLPVAQEYNLPLNDYTSDPDGLFLEYTVQTVGITDLDTIVEVTTDQDLLILPGYKPETFTIALTASDGIETAVTSITVTTVNVAPVIVPIPTQYPLYNPTTPYSVPLVFTDDDAGDSVTWSVESATVIPLENCAISSNNDALEVLVDSFYDPFTVTVKATQYESEVTFTINFVQVSDIPAGEAIFEQAPNLNDAQYKVNALGDASASYNFVVPQGVETISAVAVGSGGNAGYLGNQFTSYHSGGGGALSYSNEIAVTPGETLTVEFLPYVQQTWPTLSEPGGTALKRGDTVLLYAEAGGSVNQSGDPVGGAQNQGGRAANGVGDVKFSGGSGGNAYRGQGVAMAGGAGAAGYLADGGNANVASTAISSGGGRLISDTGGNLSQGSTAGGGVGLFGAIYTNTAGSFSRGVDGGYNSYPYQTEQIGNSTYARPDNLVGPNYGGGNGMVTQSGTPLRLVSPPYNGAVRIIYGSGRLFPNSGTQQVPATPLFTSDPVNFTITPGQTRTWNVTAESLEGSTVSYSFAIYEENNDITLDDISINGSEITVTLPTSANDDAPFKIIVLATDDVTGGVVGQIADFTPIMVAGQIEYGVGTHTFTVPDRVYNLSAVLVGGGGAGGWQSAGGGTGGTTSFGVLGESFYFYATGGGGGGQGQVNPASYNGGAGGSPGGSYHGGGSGGAGRNIGGSNQRGAGGGAGGYAGNGGDGEGFNVHPQTLAGEGGGVGIFGQGTSGDGSLVWLHTGYGVANGSGGSGTGGGGYSTFYSTYGSRQVDGMAGSGGSAAPPVDAQLGIEGYGGGGSGGANDGTFGAGAGGGGLAYRHTIAVTPGQQITVTVGDRGFGAISTRGGRGAARIVWGSNRRYPTNNLLDAGIAITNTTSEFTYPQNSTQTISLTVSNPNSENYTWSVIPLTNRLTQENFTFDGNDLSVYLPGDDDVADHKFTVLVETDLGYKDAIDFTITPTVSSGEQVYTTSGSYTFIVPDGVGTIHGVAVGGGAGGAVGGGGAAGGGGGGLGWGSFPVTPGETITIAVGEAGLGSVGGGLGTDGGDSIISYDDTTVIAGYGGTAGDGSASVNPGGSFLAPSNGGGGAGGNSQIPGSGFQYAAGGGGAGGYSGNGGNGGTYGGSPGSGQGGAGAGGFSAGASQDSAAGGGGGVGIYGEGPSGLSISSIAPAPGGSGGTDGATRNGTLGGLGGTYGGGGGGSNGTAATNPQGGDGGSGAVRIVWGRGVSYPDNAIPAQASIYEYSSSTETFTVPTGITSIGVAAVGSGGYADWINSTTPRGGGGGAMSFTNSISVTPYETLDIVFDGSGSGIQRDGTWLVYAEDGTWITGGSAANGIGEVRFSGGESLNGPANGSGDTTYLGAGGAGAGSYTDPGGNASTVYNGVNAFFNTGTLSTATRTGAGYSGTNGTNPWGGPTAGGGGVGLQGANILNDTINLTGGGAYSGGQGTYTPGASVTGGNALGGEYGGGNGYAGQNLDRGNNYSLWGAGSKTNNGAVAVFFSTAENQISIPGGDLNIYSFDVINNGSSAYTVTGTDNIGEVSGDNPTININVGDILVFNVNALNHPLYFKNSVVTGTDDTVDLAEGQGTEVGKMCWTPKTAGTYIYICEFHGTMYGQIIVGNS